ncbi:hypothetical protein IX39_18970 [Chryseobacterium formosense]|uniref:Branched-chain amino acid:cation transporter, LIVCS family n=1 Tax=Chryseobacterium formosense TaxID=236814 RepID=A0A085Z076_9FLAO|nr:MULTISPECIES: hypothetical protein [Chryseobacterium]KFE97839.1 hypothetical protein IX39_18970 [Chryseobacterium formosense]OCK51824.1 hypothetical protein BA768_15040 [Chryseobacterium sp. CBo1]SFT83130.1 branched-chain amino acid:cation transporter, LIVCS family [Chryseobacterium formosense]
MKNKDIITVGKISFWLFFILGNICLFGYLVTKIEAFASYGFLLLFFAAPVNLVVIAILIIYGLFNKHYLKECIKAALIICINIPIAILYFYLGIFLMGFSSN